MKNHESRSSTKLVRNIKCLENKWAATPQSEFFFIQYCVQRLRDCHSLEIFYFKFPIAKFKNSHSTSRNKKTDFHYILLGF